MMDQGKLQGREYLVKILTQAFHGRLPVRARRQGKLSW